jgi:hypothetical protein
MRDGLSVRQRRGAAVAVAVIGMLVGAGGFLNFYFQQFSSGGCGNYTYLTITVETFSDEYGEMATEDSNQTGTSSDLEGWRLTLEAVSGKTEWTGLKVQLKAKDGFLMASMNSVGQIGPLEPNYNVNNNYVYIKDWAYGGDMNGTNTESFSFYFSNCQVDTHILDRKMFAVSDSDGDGIGDACECYADLDNSGGINGFDLIRFKHDFGKSTCKQGGCFGDMDGNGRIDGQDLLIMKLQFGRADCPSAP